MNDVERRPRAVLTEMARIASAAAGADPDDDNCADDQQQQSMYGFVIKSLPSRLWIRAARNAAEINPVNAPGPGPCPVPEGGARIDAPLHIAALTTKYSGANPRTLTVSFMETTAADLRSRIPSRAGTRPPSTSRCSPRWRNRRC